LDFLAEILNIPQSTDRSLLALFSPKVYELSAAYENLLLEIKFEFSNSEVQRMQRDFNLKLGRENMRRLDITTLTWRCDIEIHHKSELLPE